MEFLKEARRNKREVSQLYLKKCTVVDRDVIDLTAIFMSLTATGTVTKRTELLGRGY